MFGMTKKQFLKKSKTSLKDTGVEVLLIRELYNQEKKGSISFEEAHHKLEKIRKNLENIFFQYEKLKPPSKCKKLQLRLLSILIILQESVVANAEYINSAKNGSNEHKYDKLKNSFANLEKFRNEFMNLSHEVDLYLKQ